MPENPYEPAFARMPFNSLDEKEFYRYNHPSHMLYHGFEPGRWIDEYRYICNPDSWTFDPRPTYSNAPRAHGFSSHHTDDIWTRYDSSLPRSRQYSGLSRSAYRECGKTSISNQYKDERDTRVSTNSSRRSKKRAFPGFDSLGIEREQPKRNKKHNPSSSQKKVNESKTIDKTKALPEKPVTLEDALKSPTPPSSIGNPSSPLKVPKASPKIKLPRHRVPEVATDEETDERDKNLASPEEGKLSATVRERWRQRRAQDKCNRQPIESAEKACLWNGQGDRNYHRRGVSGKPLEEVPPRSSSIGFYSHFTIGRKMPFKE
ncbi:hypothetical protein F4820DRAFT_450209 [Hypoxylon rubiginosum]|uniref:Uncharacterized protein n=1 Tax=Hypoxylon rubiginosum TaxID=110542 RepID=A0ACB9YVL0_9PEZI|nr:hypothetical protein F4820DRAFT_450209 [Hypoxylon rubiginosum]